MVGGLGESHGATDYPRVAHLYRRIFCPRIGRLVMSMTRKNYQAIATNFGFEMRDQTGSKQLGMFAMVRAFCEVAKQDNPLFDEDTFTSWVYDTSMRLRDLDGKRVKSA
jgi:hypothetical protein